MEDQLSSEFAHLIVRHTDREPYVSRYGPDLIETIGYNRPYPWLASGCTDAAISRDGRWLLARPILNDFRAPWLAHADVGHFHTELPDEHSVVVQAAFHPDSRYALLAFKSGFAQLWDLEKRPGPGPVGPGLPMPGEPRQIGFSPDGRIAFGVGSADERVHLWDPWSGLPLGPPLEHPGVVQVAFHPNGQAIATAGKDGMVRLWRLPAPVEGTPVHLRCWVEALTRREFVHAPAEGVEVLTNEQAGDRRLRLGAEFGGEPAAPSPVWAVPGSVPLELLRAAK